MSISSKKILPATIQPKDIEWYTFTPDTYVDGLEKRTTFLDLTFDTAGNIYIAGGYFSNSNPALNAEDVTAGIAVIKLDSSKNIVWKKFIATNYHQATSIQYMKPFNSQECVVLGITAFYSNANVSCISLNTSDGSIIDQIKLDESASGRAFEIFDMIPHPAATNNDVLMCVGKQWNTSRNGDMSLSGSIGLTSSGAFTVTGFSYRSVYYNNDQYEQAFHRLCYDSLNNKFCAVGRTSASSFYETTGEVSAASTNSYISTARAFRYSDYINGAGMSDVVADSSGNKYYGHSDGTITKSVNIFSGAIWRRRCYSSSAYKSPMCLALSQDEQFLYAANGRNSIIKYATSDGSLVAEMVVPSQEMGSIVYSPRFRDHRGFKSIAIKEGVIYLTLNYPVKSWANHGSLLIIPESKFGSSEYKLENGVALINADNLATPDVLSTTAPTTSLFGNAATTQSISTPTQTVSDLDLFFNSEIHVETAPVIIYGLNNGQAGSSSTAQFIKNLMSNQSYGTYTLSAKENDLSFFAFSYAGTGLGVLYTATSGYITARTILRTDTYSTSATLQYKRMGAVPDTSIYVPYTQDATRGNNYRIVLIRGVIDPGFTPFVSTAASSANTYNPPIGSLVVSEKSLVLSWGFNGTNSQYISAASSSSWTEYTTANQVCIQGNDTYDATTYLAATLVPSAQTFTPSSTMKGYATDSTTYSAVSFTIGIGESNWG